MHPYAYLRNSMVVILLNICTQRCTRGCCLRIWDTTRLSSWCCVFCRSVAAFIQFLYVYLVSYRARSKIQMQQQP